MQSEVRSDAMGVRIALTASVFFDSGSSKLKFGALKSLDKIAEILKKSPHRLMIEGHTDDQPISSGPLTSNWELASLRASTVVRYFIKFHQMDATKLAAISYADQKPLVPNSSDENRAKNRRIEILIVTNDDLDN